MKDLLGSLRRAAGRMVGASPGPEQPHPEARQVLFVCMGNICRSPTAEGVFRKLVAERAPELRVHVESAGTHAFHVGDPPDARACRAAQRRGVDLTGQRARQVVPEDFARFELVLAMDSLNLADLRGRSRSEHHPRIKLFLDFAPQLDRHDVPDPYYGGTNGFEHVLDLVEEASVGLIEHLRKTVPPARTEPAAQKK